MGLAFFPRGGSAHVARNLALALGGAGWDVTILSGSLAAPGEPGDAREFYAGLDVRPLDFTRALEAPDPMRADPPMHPSFEDRPGAADRVFASLDDDEFERQVTAWCARAGGGRRGAGRRAAPAPPDADPRGGARGSRPACRSSATCTAPSCSCSRRSTPTPTAGRTPRAWAARMRAWAGACER